MGSCCPKNSVQVMPSISPAPEPPQKITKFEIPEKALLNPVKDDQANAKTNENSINCKSANSPIKLEAKMFKIERKYSKGTHFELLELIGKGTFGEVRKIRDQYTSKIYVMKSILKSQCQKTESIIDEIEILKQLDHPHIARFYEFYQDDLKIYLIMEYFF